MMAVRRPKLFKLLSSKAQRLLRKFLEPKKDRRPSGLKDLSKYLDEKWLTRSITDKSNGKCLKLFATAAMELVTKIIIFRRSIRR